jgi:CRP-like cAMP-binding protein
MQALSTSTALSISTAFEHTRVPAVAPILRGRPQARAAHPAGAQEAGRHTAPHDADLLPRATTTVTVPRNRAIYFEGDPAEHYYRVVSGTVRICKETEDGRRQIASFPAAGNLFGWAGRTHHGYSAEAVTDVTLLRWHRRTIEAAILADPDAGHRILAILFEQLGEAQTHLLLLGRMRATERVAAFLLARAERYRREGFQGGRVPLPMCRKDIADYLGLTVETVSRTMHALKQRGVIGFGAGDAVQIADHGELERLGCGLGA